ncbi:MAG TPA: hypothetical protein VMT87_01380 [Vicinamibacteria bacterium]|nr:hypothetical protein [Vicinamibacteria bacterium]
MAERAVNPFVEQFRKGGVPRDLRLMAAQGALPLKPADLAELLHHLLSDADHAIGQSAAATLTAMPAEEIVPITRDRDTPPALLGWVLSAREEREVREAALQNPSTPDEAVEGITEFLGEELAELVVINQVRLLRRTSLLQALEKNAQLNKDQQRRLRELRESFRIGQAGAPAPPPPAPAPPPEPEPSPADELAAPPVDLASLSPDEAVVHILSEDERTDKEKVNVVQEIYRLNSAQKVIMALKGSREQRSVLVRDPNRMVATAVLGSPRLTEAEVESFAGMRNISDEILRQIGMHRDWTKKYAVVANLVKNPRTPIGVSLSMVSRLNPRDIKGLTTDRNVPEVIRKQAQKFVKDKGDPKKK